MEDKVNLIEPLVERVEQYGKVSFELIKLKSLAKAADITSTLLSRIILTIVISLFVLTLNIAAALWLGDIVGENYLGFLIVASFYAVLAIILLFSHSFIKAKAMDSIITQMLN